MSLSLSSNGRHTPDEREHAAAAGDGSPQEPLTASVALALVLVFLALGGFILTNDAVLGVVSAALSWVLFALCWYQGFGGGRQGSRRIENAPGRHR